MGRTPCCDSKGIKKGPWAPEEDKLLVDFVEANGPGNWRMLPKLAGTCSASLSSWCMCDLVVSLARSVLELSGLMRQRDALACRAEPVRQELPAPVDQLPAPGHQARAFHHRGAQFHPPSSRHRRQQVSVLPSCTEHRHIDSRQLITRAFMLRTSSQSTPRLRAGWL